MDVVREHTPAVSVTLVIPAFAALAMTGDANGVLVNEVAIVVSERMDPVTVAWN